MLKIKVTEEERSEEEVSKRGLTTLTVERLCENSFSFLITLN